MMFGDMTWRQGLCFAAFLMVAVVVCVEGSDKHYTNSFVVEVQDGDSPHSLAKRHNLDYLGQVRLLTKRWLQFYFICDFFFKFPTCTHPCIHVRIDGPYASYLSTVNIEPTST